MAYSEKVIDHYEHPRNVGAFDKQEPDVGTGMVGAPACGDVMKLQIKVNKEGIIEDKTLEQAMTIRNTQIAEELALPPVKIHCSILAEDAIKAAIEDYKSKHGAQTSERIKAA
jgi:nitrogen fixation NifU-like protein